MKKIIFKSKLKILISIILISICSFMNIYIAFGFKNILDYLNIKNLESLKNEILIVLVIIIFTTILIFIKNLYLKHFKNSIIFEYTNRIFKNIIRNDQIDFKSGEIISQLTNKIPMTINTQLETLFTIIEAIILFIFSLISLILIDIKIALIILFLSIIMVLTPRIFKNKLRLKNNIFLNSLNEYNQRLSETFYGFRIIKSYKAYNIFKNRLKEKAIDNEQKNYEYKNLSQKINSFLNAVNFLIQITILLVVSVLVVYNNLSIGYILAVGQLMDFLASPLSILIETINNFNSFEDAKFEIEKLSNKNKVYGNIEKKNFYNKLEIKNVNVEFEGEKILKNINLEFEKGKKYVLVGESGSGKSTILKLLNNKIKPISGKVFIDGVDISTLSYYSLKNLFKMVSSDNHIFNETVKFNLKLGEDIEDNKIREVLDKVDLEFVYKKMNEKFSDSKEILSSGQRQRLALSRALIRKSQILLLDEISANLDYENSIIIENIIKNLQCTIIAIRHRIDNSLCNYDKIILVKDKKAYEISFEKLKEEYLKK
ncbi:MAG: ABC transporter ATP-binding protein [Tissierellia bacterium]|nr:ABC transporter ATP-binding protein [Tissierellia bacterium]